MEAANKGFTHIKDTLSSGTLDSLISSGIIPSGLRIIKGVVDFSLVDNQKSAVRLSVLHADSKQPIVFKEGDIIAYISALHPAPATDGSQTLKVGLWSSAEDADALDDPLFSSAAGTTKNSSTAMVKIGDHLQLKLVNSASMALGLAELLIIVV